MTAEQLRNSILQEAISGRLTQSDTSDWREITIGQLGTVVTGTTPSKQNKEYYGDDYPFYKPSDLDAGIYTVKASDGLSKGERFCAGERKVAIKDLISECANHVNRDQIIQFIENILNSKPPSEQDPLYHDMLNNLRTGSIVFKIQGDFVAGDKYTGTVVKEVKNGGIGVQEKHE